MIKIANNLKYMVAKKKTDKPEAEAEAEELVGDQDKLDLNNNKRLDAQDFKMIRSKKSADGDDGKLLQYFKEQREILGKDYIHDDALAGSLGGFALGGLGGAAYEHFRAPNEDGSEKDYLKSILRGGGIGFGVGGLGGLVYGYQTGDDRRYEAAQAHMKSTNPGGVLFEPDFEHLNPLAEKELRKSLKDPETKINNQKLIEDLEKSMADKAKATKAK